MPISLALLFTLLLSSLVHAQGTKAEVRFLAEQLPKGLGEVCLFAEEKQSEGFTLPTNNLSKPQTAPARSFVLRPLEKPTTLATVNLPENGKSFIVLLIPSTKGGYSPVVIASDQAGFKAGDVYFYNHCNQTVLGYVGSEKFTLAPAKGLSLRPKGARAEGFYDVGFGVREEEGNRTLSTTRWPVDEQIRSYVFFFLNPKTKRVDFRAVDEFVPPTKAE